jgi:hypothetical protein
VSRHDNAGAMAQGVPCTFSVLYIRKYFISLIDNQHFCQIFISKEEFEAVSSEAEISENVFLEFFFKKCKFPQFKEIS